MAALAPVAAETNAYRSQSHENIMIAALKPQDLERVNRAEVAKPGPWLVPTQDRQHSQIGLGAMPVSDTPASRRVLSN
jgi:hypothetical protein